MARPTRPGARRSSSNLFATPRTRGRRIFESARSPLCGIFGISDTTGFRLRTEAFSIAPLPSCLPLLNPLASPSQAAKPQRMGDSPSRTFSVRGHKRGARSAPGAD